MAQMIIWTINDKLSNEPEIAKGDSRDEPASRREFAAGLT